MQENRTPNPSEDNEQPRPVTPGEKRIKLKPLGGSKTEPVIEPAAKDDPAPPAQPADKPADTFEDSSVEEPQPIPEGDIGDDLVIKSEESKPKSPIKRLAFFLIPGVLVALGLIYMIRSADLLDSDLVPLRPTEKETEESAAKDPGKINTQAIRQLDIEPDTAGLTDSLETYMDSLGRQPLVASASPRGIFIGTVFFPEGSAINPSLEVTFEALQLGEQPVAVFNGPDGQSFQLPVELK